MARHSDTSVSDFRTLSIYSDIGSNDPTCFTLTIYTDRDIIIRLTVGAYKTWSDASWVWLYNEILTSSFDIKVMKLVIW